MSSPPSLRRKDFLNPPIRVYVIKEGKKREGGKANLSLSDRPWLIEALIATILFKPSYPSSLRRSPPLFRSLLGGRRGVKCSLPSISIYACLNNSKSARFLVIKGNLSKWLIITVKSFTELILNWTNSEPCFVILPTLK